ncbi:hypothetical protein EZJ43_09625 [Pedobacter changchengzhani]|uniref:Uncharacterized protein n=1 Tax=Pedobacter changchengzhani TaxID=2529274 RepID=A0A4V3A086_9SPHI|nr:hypothetical protein [Pedobacter changchengzhani]TDG36253.1 hypothetical protein EZJ43_09625 [Pedobacter changchengzhani]
MSGDKMMMLIMFGLFFFMVAIMITANWYTKKYNTKISFFQIVMFFFALIFGGFWFFIKQISSSEKDNIVKMVALKNTVVGIYNEPRKAYFKEMKFDDGRALPMPEEMLGIVQIGDSIYKNKGDDFYTIVNSVTKKSNNFKVKVHERVLSKPQ